MKSTLCRLETAEFEIKKSRFIVHAGPVASNDDVSEFLSRQADPEARHNCYAWRIGDHYRFFDADEPGGTAGRPILQAIDGQGLDQVVVMVTRWFGGIKLGAGGLVRAYGGSAAECLRLADRRPLLVYRELALHAPFDQLGALHHLLDQLAGTKLVETFDEHGSHWRIRLLDDRVESFKAQVRDISRGKVHVEPEKAAQTGAEQSDR